MEKASLILSDLYSRVKKFSTEHKKEFTALMMILMLALFLRLFRISEYLTFLGDEGRDAIVVRRLLVYADPILVGPGTSIGNMYLGPLYYYFMAPWLWLFNYSPTGPAVGVALLGVVTVWLMWFMSREWFGKSAAIIAALLYAISPLAIIYSRSSWNPNIMPFFALLCVYAVWRIWQHQQYRWFLILGASFAAVLQSHYLGLLLAPTLVVFLLLSFLSTVEKRSFITHSLLGLGVFSFLMSPLIIFDARHGWRNVDALKKFFLERQTTVSARPWNALPKFIPISQKVITRLVTAKNELFGNIVLLTLFVPFAWMLDVRKKIKLSQKNRAAFLVLIAWISFAFIGLGLYKQEIYDHYYGFFFPAPFLLLAGICQVLVKQSPIRGKSLVIVGISFLTILNLLDNPLRYAPNRQLQRTQEVAQKIIEVSENQPFNLAVIAERNYDDAYQYFLEVDNAQLKDIDPQKADETITDQLFVVCELPKEKCDPTHNPKAEVANFGWSAIEESWDVAGVTLFKLVHTQ